MLDSSYMHASIPLTTYFCLQTNKIQKHIARVIIIMESTLYTPTDNQLHYSVNKTIQSSTMNLNSQFTRRWSILATACRGLQVIWPAAARGGGWNADTLKLVNLGSGSFCVARFLETIAMDDDDITVSHGSDIGGNTNTSYAWWQLQWQQKWWS